VRDALFSSRDSGYLPSRIAGNGWHSRFGDIGPYSQYAPIGPFDPCFPTGPTNFRPLTPRSVGFIRCSLQKENDALPPMSTTTLSRTGQITIPRTIRERLFLQAGDQLELTFTETGDLLLRPVTQTVDELCGRLHRPGQTPLSPEDMDQAIRERSRDKGA